MALGHSLSVLLRERGKGCEAGALAEDEWLQLRPAPLVFLSPAQLLIVQHACGICEEPQ